MRHIARLALAALAAALIPACGDTLITNQSTTNTTGGGVSLPPGALGSGTVLILSNRSTLLNTTTGEQARVLYEVALGGFLAGGEKITAIDYRPSNNTLYGLSDQGRLYTVDPGTGALTAVNAVPIMAFTGTRFGMDFNPVFDFLRIVTDADENIRVNPDTGTVIAVDIPLTPSGDVFEIAYSYNFPGATSTTLFAIDQATGSLYRLDNPNTGVMTLVGPVLSPSPQQGGFDISASNLALTAHWHPPQSPALGRVDLFVGTVNGIFNIPTNFEVWGLAIVP